MHTIHTTEGFILKSLNFGEANRYFFIFSQEFGLIKSTAQSVRQLKSKLRYGLEDYSLSLLSVVRGREVWRITNAEKLIKISEPERLSLLSRLFSLLLRLLHGEEKNERLFAHLRAGVDFLVTANLMSEDLSNFECIMALRILSALGYIGQLGDFDQFIQSPYFTPELLTAMSTLKSRAILEINKSLHETHL
jgi:recombinational DNA repair protein (RecF pathway)